MPDGMKIENGEWRGEDGSFVLPAMARSPGANGYFYFAPLRAVEATEGGTLVFDVQELRAALYALTKQMATQGTKPARRPRRKRRTAR